MTRDLSQTAPNRAKTLKRVQASASRSRQHAIDPAQHLLIDRRGGQVLVHRMAGIRRYERREVARGGVQLLHERGDARVLRPWGHGGAVEEAEG